MLLGLPWEAHEHLYDYQEPAAPSTMSILACCSGVGCRSSAIYRVLPGRQWQNLLPAPIVEKRHPMATAIAKGTSIAGDVMWSSTWWIAAHLRPADRWTHGVDPDALPWWEGYTAEVGLGGPLTELFTKPQDWLGDASLDERCRPHGAIN